MMKYYYLTRCMCFIYSLVHLFLFLSPPYIYIYIYIMYLPIPSIMSRMAQKDNFKAKLNWIVFRLFILLDLVFITKVRESCLLYHLPVAGVRRKGFVHWLAFRSITANWNAIIFVLDARARAHTHTHTHIYITYVFIRFC